MSLGVLLPGKAAQIPRVRKSVGRVLPQQCLKPRLLEMLIVSQGPSDTAFLHQAFCCAVKVMIQLRGPIIRPTRVIRILLKCLGKALQRGFVMLRHLDKFLHM